MQKISERVQYIRFIPKSFCDTNKDGLGDLGA